MLLKYVMLQFQGGGVGDLYFKGGVVIAKKEFKNVRSNNIKVRVF